MIYCAGMQRDNLPLFVCNTTVQSADPGAVLGAIHQLVSAGQHVASTNFCTTFACICLNCYAILCNTHFIHLFIQSCYEACVEGYPGQFLLKLFQ